MLILSILTCIVCSCILACAAKYRLSVEYVLDAHLAGLLHRRYSVFNARLGLIFVTWAVSIAYIIQHFGG